MKKTLLIIAALCLVLAACDETKTEKPEAPKANEFSINTISVTDTIQCSEEILEEAREIVTWVEDDKAYYHYEMDLPVTDNQALKDSIEAYLLAGLNTYSDNPDQVTNYKELGDAKALLELDKERFANGQWPASESNTYKKMVENADKYVTYIEEVQTYNCGAAHGEFSRSGATFKKETGKTFTWDMFTDKDMALEIIKYAMLEQYFEVNLDEFNEEDLYEYFDLSASWGLSLPVCNPWIHEGKLVAIYQQYEACNYSFGLPECEVPYEQIKDFLTDEGKSFFE